MMKKIIILSIFNLAIILLNAQTERAINQYTNSADLLLSKDSKLVIGGYGEVHYNQALDRDKHKNGDLDVHRVIMMLGYHFNEKTQFISELEFEHVKEVYVEQAFLQHSLNQYIKFRAGLMLTPMGIINEYHEPSTFNGVERPLLDKYIAPTTWREIGFGITGSILPVSIKYQAYLMNGFNGYDDAANLDGKNGFRKGRQKGAESYISSPNYAGKIEYYGIRGLNIGLSGYFGKTQSALYHNIKKDDAAAIAKADSSVVGIKMLGLDTRYNYAGFELRGQLYYAKLSNTAQYNQFGGSDVGNTMIGYYVEAAYNLLRPFDTGIQLSPFARYEYFDTHHGISAQTARNLSYKKTAITSGITLKLTNEVAVKADMQWLTDASTHRYQKTFNAGIGVMF